MLDRAAAMDPVDRVERFRSCGTHDRFALDRAPSGAVDSAPYFCPVCCTVFSAAGFHMWNQPRTA